MAQEINCIMCGMLIKNPARNQKYCPACSVISRQGVAARCLEKKKLKAKQDKDSADNKKRAKFRSKDVLQNNAPREWDLTGKSADQITCESRALGLSYGIYSAACRAGTIEWVLKDMGLEPPEALKIIKKAWRERKQKSRMDYVYRPAAPR